MMISKMRILAHLFLAIFLTLGLSISLQSLLAAWTPPSAAPPNGNVTEPLYTATLSDPVNQTKYGILNLIDGFTVDTNTLVVDATGNKVGIGMNDPNVKLTIGTKGGNVANGTIASFYNGDETTLKVLAVANTNGTGAHMQLMENNPNLYGFDTWYDTGNNMLLIDSYVNNTKTNIIDITTAGNVGIGAVNPNARLTVKTNTAFNQFSLITEGVIAGGWARGADMQYYESAAPTTLHRGFAYGMYGSGDTLTGTYFSSVKDDAAPWTTAQLFLNSNGNVGIGTNAPVNQLTVLNDGSDAITMAVGGPYPAVSGVSGTNYYKQLEIKEPVYKIPTGYTENGYRIGLAVQGYVSTSDFAGTLKDQYGAWIRTGSNSNNPTGTITNSYGVYIDNLSSPNVTITKSYGLYQSSSGAMNYFAGNVGIGTNAPGTKLDVAGVIQSNDMGRFKGWTATGATGRAVEVGISSGIGYVYNYDRTASTYGELDFNNAIRIVGSNGNIGIHTTAPTLPVDIRGYTRIDGSASYDVWIQGGSSTAGGDARNLAMLGIKATDVLSINHSSEYAGGTQIGGPVSVVGNLTVSGQYLGGSCDVAERYQAVEEDSEILEPGDIVSLSADNELKIEKVSAPLSSMAIGVYSTKPQMVMGDTDEAKDRNDPPVALIGRVPVKVTDENGPVKVGDLIVSSSKPGYGMGCRLKELDLSLPEDERWQILADNEKCRNAAIGKALENLGAGEGRIEVFLTKGN